MGDPITCPANFSKWRPCHLPRSAPAFADPVKVVAAENFYGDVANQIGGANVAVTSIITNPDEDPHLFEASTETLRALTDAKVVVDNELATTIG